MPDGTALFTRTFSGYGSQHYIGGRGDGAQLLNNGSYTQALIIAQSAWSAGKMLSIHRNPWRILEPETSVLYWAAAAASTGNHRITGGGWGGRVISDQLRKAA